MLMSRGHFRHPPVSGDADLVGMPDITDVCRALIDPDLSQPPNHRQHPLTVIPAAPPVVSSACRT